LLRSLANNNVDVAAAKTRLTSLKKCDQLMHLTINKSDSDVMATIYIRNSIGGFVHVVSPDTIINKESLILQYSNYFQFSRTENC